MPFFVLLCALGCSVGDPGPASPGSAASDTRTAGRIAEKAAAIEAMAIELEEEVLKARELQDPAQRRQAAQDINDRIQAIEQHNRELQEAVRAYGEALRPGG